MRRGRAILAGLLTATSREAAVRGRRSSARTAAIVKEVVVYRRYGPWGLIIVILLIIILFRLFGVI